MNEEFCKELVEDVFDHDCTLVTNFDEDLRHLYEEAIKRYGDNKLHICNNAYDSLGRPIDRCLALHYTGEGNLTEFWDIYNQICKEEMGN